MRILLPFALVLTLFGLVLFGSAGRIDLPFVWAYLGVMAVNAAAVSAVVDRGLIAERMKPGPGGTDRKLRMMASPLLLAHLVVGGLDVGRFHWSGAVPTWVHVAGLAGLAAALGLMVWAIGANPFFSPVVRIQEERGHTLVSKGPYGFVRHPGYAGALVAFPCGGLALGSWWSLVPLAPALLLIVRRTMIEDRFLSEHLEGYVDYAARVRCRIIPGVW